MMYRITIAIILVSLACLCGYAWERGRHKRFARAWASEIIDPTYYLIR